MGSRLEVHNRRQETIPLARHSLDKDWAFCGITKDLAKLVHRGLQVCVEVHECVRRPQSATQFLASGDPASTLKQKNEELEWLLLQLDAGALLAELVRGKIDLEHAELQTARRARRILRRTRGRMVFDGSGI